MNGNHSEYKTEKWVLWYLDGFLLSIKWQLKKNEQEADKIYICCGTWNKGREISKAEGDHQ